MTPEQQRLIDQIRLHEGSRSKPYKDTVGKLTIGVGRNLDDVGLFDDEIELLLINDLKRFERSLDKSLPWWRDLDEVRQRVILDMCFNMGLGGLLGFKNTLAKIKAHDWAGARRGMLQSKWAKQVGARATRLADMMLTGKDYR
jgi:lysozyme